MDDIRIVLADDHRLVRAGIRALLEEIAGVTVVAEASDGAEALAAAREHRPEVLLTDLTMKGMNGLDLIERVRAEFPEIRVVVLSMHTDPDYVQRALRLGAAAYLVKDAATAELATALEAVARGESYLSPAISRTVIEGYTRRDSEAPSPLAALTARQQEILRLIASGQSTKEIAFALGVSVKTVESHRAQIMERLDIHDIAGLVRFAVREGLVSARE